MAILAIPTLRSNFEISHDSGELLICHLSIHIISFECPLQKKGKRKTRKKPKEKEREKKGVVL